MFYPNVSAGKYDRHIFSGQGESVTLITGKPVKLLFYFMGSNYVGVIEGNVKALAYRGYKRGDFLPVEIVQENNSYCGWVNLNDVEVLPN